ncbi:MAG: ParA family protein, partial [Gammaproteobacteria bacterium]
VRLAEAQSHGLPVLRYDSSSRGATAYLALAGEYLRRHVAETVNHEATDAATADKPVSRLTAL